MTDVAVTSPVASDAIEVYLRHIKPLPAAERLRLLAMIAEDLADQRIAFEDEAEVRVTDFHGLARDAAAGMDAQAYVNQLRAEWDH
jgi:hypothetical protein